VIVASGDTVTLHHPGTDAGAYLLVGAIDPATGTVEQSAGRRPRNGITRLQTGDGFVAWLDHPLEEGAPVHLRLVEVAPDGTPTTDAIAWSPWGTSPVEVAAFALAGSQLAWIEAPDEDGNARISVVDLASTNRAPIVLGEYETRNVFEIAMTETQLVWRDAARLYALPAPFETSRIREIGDIAYAGSSSAFRVGLQVAGNVVGWQFDRSVFLYDGARPVEPEVNPRRVDAVYLRSVTPRYAMFFTNPASMYWLDVRNPDAERQRAATNGSGLRTHVRLYGHHLVYARCRNSVTTNVSLFGVGLGSSTRCAADGDVAIWARDLEDVGAAPVELASGLPELEDLAGGPLGVVWRAGTGDDEVVQYWNPAAPVAASANPLGIGDGTRTVLAPTFTDAGLAFYTRGEGGDSIEFIDALDLLLDTDDGL